MRTPKEVFREMPSIYGEIWKLTETGWICWRKDASGVRYTDHSKLQPPLAVFDLLSVSQQVWAYFNNLTGEHELLISFAQKVNLEASRPKDLLAHEGRRLEEMKRLQKDQIDEFLKGVALTVAKLTGKVFRVAGPGIQDKDIPVPTPVASIDDGKYGSN
jgi:hypothetical protein